MERLSLLVPLVCLMAACAPPFEEDFGLRPMARERFPDLERSLEGRAGQSLIVFAQENLGQYGPAQSDSARGFRRFSGVLAATDSGWVTLARGSYDSIRISMGHVTGIWTARRGNRVAGALLGAALFGTAAWAMIGTESIVDRPSETTRMVGVSASAVLGAILGRHMFGGARRGERIYPVQRAR